MMAMTLISGVWREAQRGGGTIALKALLDRMVGRLIIASLRSGRENEVVIARVADTDEIEHLTPCVAMISREEVREGSWHIDRQPECRVLYVVLPRYFTPSDSVRLIAGLRMGSHDPRRLVFVLQD